MGGANHGLEAEAGLRAGASMIGERVEGLNAPLLVYGVGLGDDRCGELPDLSGALWAGLFRVLSRGVNRFPGDLFDGGDEPRAVSQSGVRGVRVVPGYAEQLPGSLERLFASRLILVRAVILFEKASSEMSLP